MIPKNRLSSELLSRPYPIKHKIPPAQSKREKKPVNSCSSKMYHGVEAFSVRTLKPIV